MRIIILVDLFSRFAFSNISRGFIFADFEYGNISWGFIFAVSIFITISRTSKLTNLHFYHISNRLIFTLCREKGRYSTEKAVFLKMRWLKCCQKSKSNFHENKETGAQQVMGQTFFY